MINLIYKKNGDLVNVKALKNLINEKKEISSYHYFLLYQVLDDKDYLRRALEALKSLNGSSTSVHFFDTSNFA